MQSRPTESSHKDTPVGISQDQISTLQHGFDDQHDSRSESLRLGETSVAVSEHGTGTVDASKVAEHASSADTLKDAQDAINAHHGARDGAYSQHATEQELTVKPPEIPDQQSVASSVNLVDLPNEVLTHVFSHLPPESLTSVALVSRRFCSLITTPHAWRIAFARYFPGISRNSRTASTQEDERIGQKRYFNRLSTLASWRSEYILRTRLLRALNRGKPGEAISAKPRSSSAAVAQIDYFSSIMLPITQIDALLSNNLNRPTPNFIHGANYDSLTTISVPGIGMSDDWGIRGPVFRLEEFADLYLGERPYGLGRGQIVGLPNSLSVSRKHGMICGEGIPRGRIYYRPIDEQRGRLLMNSLPTSAPELGIPFLDSAMESMCCVWISRSSNIVNLSDGLVGLLSGSSLGVVTAYSLGPSSLSGQRLERGEMTARWMLSPGVPIIAISIDEQYSTRRSKDNRIWAVALNALGEVFYTTELPRRTNIKGDVVRTEDATYALAWQTGRTVSWSLVEPTRRTARIDPYGTSSVDGSYSPRGSSDSMGLSKEQIFAETKEIEQFVRKSPNHFQSICEGWDMRRRLEVDFAGCNENKAGESIVVFECALEEEQKSSIKRFTRFMQKESITPQALESHSPMIEAQGNDSHAGAIGAEPSWSFGAALSRRNSTTSSTSSTAGIFETWRVSTLSFGGLKAPQITTTAIDCSRFALLTLSEDPLINISASTDSSPMSSPLGNMPSPVKASEIPGQRSRLIAAGTKMGTVLVWNIRAPTASSSEIVNTVEPLRIIHTDSPEISCLALTALYLVHGGNDGLVQAWDPLVSNMQPVRTINSRFSMRARRRIAQAAASPWGVGVNMFAAGALWLDPEPTSLRGMVSLGGHLRYWSFSSQSADNYKSSKRRVRKSEHAGDHAGKRFSNTGNGPIHDYIANEIFELEKEKKDRRKEEDRLAGRFGLDLLGPGATEDEIMAYATMLSEEAAKEEESKRISTDGSKAEAAAPAINEPVSPDLQDDADLAAAIQASLEEDSLTSTSHVSAPSQGFTIRYGKSRKSSAAATPGSSTQPDVDDLDFALRLSMAEDQSRRELADTEFPALGPVRTPSEGKGKGRRRS